MRHAAGRARFRARRAHGRAGPHGPCPMSTARPRPTARASGRGPRTRRPRGLRAEGGLSLVQDETRRCSEAQSYGRCHGAEQRDTIAPTHDARRLRRAACPQYSRAVRAVVTVNRPVSCARTHDMQLEHTPKCGWRAYACTAHAHGVRRLFVGVFAHVCRAGGRSAKASIRRNVTAVPSSPSPDSKTSRHHLCQGAAPTAVTAAWRTAGLSARSARWVR